MTIDLRKERTEILEHIAQRVRDFPDYEHTGPGDGEDPITFIELGFQFDQAGWVALVFDTRPDASPDGEWNSWIGPNEFERARWFEAFDELCESGTPLEIITLKGKKRRIKECDEETVAELFGDLLRDALISARDAGLFEALPLAKVCLMGVEEQSGAYGWPAWEKRKKEGRVNKSTSKTSRR